MAGGWDRIRLWDPVAGRRVGTVDARLRARDGGRPGDAVRGFGTVRELVAVRRPGSATLLAVAHGGTVRLLDPSTDAWTGHAVDPPLPVSHGCGLPGALVAVASGGHLGVTGMTGPARSPNGTGDAN